MGGWRKSTYSDANGGNCVETASSTGIISVRDTANPADVTLTLSAAAWQQFTDALK
jgi:hypothetical protein